MKQTVRLIPEAHRFHINKTSDSYSATSFAFALKFTKSSSMKFFT